MDSTDEVRSKYCNNTSRPDELIAHFHIKSGKVVAFLLREMQAFTIMHPQGTKEELLQVLKDKIPTEKQ